MHDRLVSRRIDALHQCVLIFFVGLRYSHTCFRRPSKGNHTCVVFRGNGCILGESNLSVYPSSEKGFSLKGKNSPILGPISPFFFSF